MIKPSQEVFILLLGSTCILIHEQDRKKKRKKKVCVYVHVDYTCALYIWLQGDRTCQSMKLSKLGDSDGQGRLACCNLLGGAKSWTWLTDWITKTIIYIYMGFPCGALIKNLPANTGDAASIPGSGKAFEVGNGNPLHYSCLENSMHRGAWWATVHGSQRVGQDWAQPHAHFIYIYIYIYIFLSALIVS